MTVHHGPMHHTDSTLAYVLPSQGPGMTIEDSFSEVGDQVKTRPGRTVATEGD